MSAEPSSPPIPDHPGERSPTRERVVKAVGWSALQSWGARFISLAVFVLLARLLEPQDFGVVALAMVFITLIQTIVEQSFGEAIIQRRELTASHLHTAFWTNAAIGCALALAVALCAGVIAGLLNEPSLAPVIRWLALCCAIAGFSSVPQALLRRRLGYRALALRTMVATLTSGVVAVIAAALGYGVWALVVQNVVYASLGLVLVWVASPWLPRWQFSLDSARELGTFALHSLGATLADFFNTRLIDMLIGIYLGTTALGYYAIGYKLVTILNQMLTQVTTQVSLSTFSRLQQEPARMRRAFYEAVQFTCLFAVPVFVALSLLAQQLVPLFFGAGWEPAVPLLQVLAYLGVVFALGNLFSTVAAASGRPGLRLVLILVRVGMGLALFFLLVGNGLPAIAGGYVLSALVSLPLGLWFARRLIGVEPLLYLRCCYPMLAGGAAMVLASAITEQPLRDLGSAPLQLLIEGTLVGLVYVATVLLLERSLLARVITLAQLILRRR